jgi:hypothetical protein
MYEQYRSRNEEVRRTFALVLFFAKSLLHMCRYHGTDMNLKNKINAGTTFPCRNSVPPSSSVSPSSTSSGRSSTSGSTASRRPCGLPLQSPGCSLAGKTGSVVVHHVVRQGTTTTTTRRRSKAAGVWQGRKLVRRRQQFVNGADCPRILSGIAAAAGELVGLEGTGEAGVAAGGAGCGRRCRCGARWGRGGAVLTYAGEARGDSTDR